MMGNEMMRTTIMEMKVEFDETRAGNRIDGV
jgi:hypothetical protein